MDSLFSIIGELLIAKVYASVTTSCTLVPGGCTAGNEIEGLIAPATNILVGLSAGLSVLFVVWGGAQMILSFGDDSKDLSNHSWHLGNSRFKYQRVGSKSPNPFGLYDMHGNVWEWVLDQFTPPIANPPKELRENPLVAPNTLYPRVVKGGSWDDGAVSHRSAARMGSEEAWKQQDPQIPKSEWWHTDAPFVGFRIVRPYQTPSKKEQELYWTTK